eukprot:15041786-Alexandrium_andersonii.AAC.1
MPSIQGTDDADRSSEKGRARAPLGRPEHAPGPEAPPALQISPSGRDIGIRHASLGHAAPESASLAQ